MRRLMLLRHAKTETDSASGRDIDRSLDERGLAEAAEIGAWLARQETRPGRVLVSPATRTRQTWEIVAKAFSEKPDAREIDELYAASLERLLAAIHDNGREVETLMLIAHNPGLHELSLGLCEISPSETARALHSNLPTSGVAIIDFDISDWRDVRFRGGRLAAFVTPKTLRSTAAEP